jgi:hypothetical protein
MEFDGQGYDAVQRRCCASSPPMKIFILALLLFPLIAVAA